MRRIEDVVDEYDTNDRTGRQKTRIIRWFQQHPGKRFDVAEVHAELGDELDIGQRRVGDYLKQLTEEGVLQSHGDMRKAYQLADDIMVPAKYQIRAVLQHLVAIFNFRRWGIAGSFTITTLIWAVLILPFWVLWASLVISPSDRYGPVTQSDFLTIAVAMTLWLILFVILSSVLYWIHRWHTRRGS